MGDVTEDQRAGLLEETVAAASAMVEGDAKAWVERLIAKLFDGVGPDDLAQRGAVDLARIAVDLLQAAGVRQRKRSLVQIADEQLTTPGQLHSLVRIVNDDMPFLVDSVVSELGALEVGVLFVLHPVVTVNRDSEGRLVGFEEEGCKRRESWMIVFVDRLTGDQQVDKVRSGITEVLDQVRRVVVDWRPMLQRAEAAALELARRSADAVDESDRAAAEAASFLTWLIGDHFTFMAFRAYSYEQRGEEVIYHQIPDSGLGLASEEGFRLFEQAASGQAVPPEILAFHDSPDQILLTKSDSTSRVHRRIPMDVLIIKTLDEEGELTGELRFVGLLTSTAYHASPRNVPLLKGKVERVIARAGMDPRSHNGKALLHILETFPRDELLQASEDDVLATTMGILALQDRAKTSLFLRVDPFDRYVTALVYTPRDNYSAALRRKLGEILAHDTYTTVATSTGFIPEDSRLARLHFILHRKPGAPDIPPVSELEATLEEAARSWSDRLRHALIVAHGEPEGPVLHRRYANAMPLSYSERFPPKRAIADIADFELLLSGTPLTVRLGREASAGLYHLRAGRMDEALPLSDLLPMLENLGFRVLREDGPYRVQPNLDGESRTIWLHDLALEAPEETSDFKTIKPLVEEAIVALWWGRVEDDRLNTLVTRGGLAIRDIALLRAYMKYLGQTGTMLSLASIRRTLIANWAIASQLVALFKLLFDPTVGGDREETAKRLQASLAEALDGVSSLDEDRTLRRFKNAIEHTLRTNFYQLDADGAQKSYVSFKLDSLKLDGLPEPRPMVEVFVYSPRMEGVHLRGGKVARGGIRWSDRPEDFRTEVLGLMKAQMVKNVVIVPVGSKGGFVVKKPPPGGGREALQEEGIACYRFLMRGLLDITDNLVEGAVVPPVQVVRRDEDDPYLVVAADKGTATFSDIANQISRDYGFWLDDAFASGGSAGYDHKKMGITARGAWESVKRHFREMGHDTQTQPFSVIGVGDMSGDVFGNGMLLSDQIKLVAAFNHLHIFLDPDPDVAAAFGERERLFALPRSTWDDYDSSLISPGGGVFARSLKSIPLSPEIREALAIDDEKLSPNELLNAILKAPADLLWFGGIGTYVKAADESHADAGDRTNDVLRVDAGQLRVKVVGEGANLGVTQSGRIEANQAGIKINTDALDNSAGVDCSDHEVNIKILLRGAIGGGHLAEEDRNDLLEQMTDEVARLVLRDNYQQSQAISLAEMTAAKDIDSHAALMRGMERQGRLNRAVEFLPDADAIAERRAVGQGLTRPELYVLLAYSKIRLFDQLVASDFPDDPLLVSELEHYFPDVLSARFGQARDNHRLRREIITTTVVNSMVNRVGSLFVQRMEQRSGGQPADIARAYAVVRDVFGLRETWTAIEALDNQVPATCQLEMLQATLHLVRRGTLWLLAHLPTPIDIGSAVERLRPSIVDMRSNLIASMPEARAAELSANATLLADQGVPMALAGEVSSLAELAFALDLTPLAEEAGRTVGSLAPLHFAVEERLGFASLHRLLRQLDSSDPWSERAAQALGADLLSLQARASASIQRAGGDADATTMIDGWLQKRAASHNALQNLLDEIQGQSATPGLAALVVLRRVLARLIEP
ncbi:MAG: NAD-glutamate dehydrogenase [Rhodospirillales bacterium]